MILGLRNIAVIASLIFSFTLSSCKPANTHPNQLNKLAQEKLKYSLARYLFKLPNRATEANKFSAAFDEYYRTQAIAATLSHYYKQGDTIYFQVNKIAPSLVKKKTATAGKIVLQGDNKIVYYEEVYRTWKMDEAELRQKGDKLFEEFISGKDLSKYYTHNSGKDFYIEFPDATTYYNTNNRVWTAR